MKTPISLTRRAWVFTQVEHDLFHPPSARVERQRGEGSRTKSLPRPTSPRRWVAIRMRDVKSSRTLLTFAAGQACLLLAFSGSLSAQTEAYTAEKLHAYFQKTAEDYQITVGGENLTLRKQPLMNWKNPVRTQSQGALYVWQIHGRPQVLGSIFTYEYNNVVRCRHELISLADQPLTATVESDVVWSPNRGGPEWTQWEGDLVPAETAPRRLFQMRSVARQFTGKLTTPNGQTATLTLIPQPLLRYEAASDGIIDGAVFSLAQGTDPEILLVIEAKKNEDGAMGFFYAPIRANYLGLSLELEQSQVWSAPMLLELRGTTAGQRPWSNEPFFPMTPKTPLPPPEQL